MCVYLNSVDLQAGQVCSCVWVSKGKACIGRPPLSGGWRAGQLSCETRTCGNSKTEPLIYNLLPLPHTPKCTHTHTHIATPQASPDHHLLGAIIGWDRGCIVETLGRGLTVRSSPALVLKGLSTQEQKDSERKRKREGGDTSKRAQDSQGCVWWLVRGIEWEDRLNWSLLEGRQWLTLRPYSHLFLLVQLCTTSQTNLCVTVCLCQLLHLTPWNL